MTEPNETDLTEVENTYSPGSDGEDEYWGHFRWAGEGYIRSRVDGVTRDLILAKVGKTDGVVALVENHYDIGYCPSCTSECTDVWVEVDGEKVWHEEYVYQSPIALLARWLLKTED